jgi:hypothetical protein
MLDLFKLSRQALSIYSKGLSVMTDRATSLSDLCAMLATADHLLQQVPFICDMFRKNLLDALHEHVNLEEVEDLLSDVTQELHQRLIVQAAKGYSSAFDVLRVMPLTISTVQRVEKAPAPSPSRRPSLGVGASREGAGVKEPAEEIQVSEYVELLETVMYQQAEEFMGSLPAILFQV